jgi:hypothetical protein
MSYDNLSSVSQNALKFYQQLTGEERGGFLSFLVGTISFKCKQLTSGLKRV